MSCAPYGGARNISTTGCLPAETRCLSPSHPIWAKKKPSVLGEARTLRSARAIVDIPAGKEGTKSENPPPAHHARNRGDRKCVPARRGYLFSTTAGARPLHIGAKLKQRIDAVARGTAEGSRSAAKTRRKCGLSHGPITIWTKDVPHRAFGARRAGRRSRPRVGHRPQPAGRPFGLRCHSYLDEKRVALELWAASVRDIVTRRRATWCRLKRPRAAEPMGKSSTGNDFRDEIARLEAEQAAFLAGFEDDGKVIAGRALEPWTTMIKTGS